MVITIKRLTVRLLQLQPMKMFHELCFAREMKGKFVVGPSPYSVAAAKSKRGLIIPGLIKFSAAE